MPGRRLADDEGKLQFALHFQDSRFALAHMPRLVPIVG